MLWEMLLFILLCVNVLQCSITEGASKSKLGRFSGEYRGKCGCFMSLCDCKGMALHHTKSPRSRKQSEQPSSWPSDDHSGVRPPPAPLLSFSASLWYLVANRFFTITRPIRELNKVLGRCVISVVRSSVCPGCHN